MGVSFLLDLSHGLLFVSILKGEGSIKWSGHGELSVGCRTVASTPLFSILQAEGDVRDREEFWWHIGKSLTLWDVGEGSWS